MLLLLRGSSDKDILVASNRVTGTRVTDKGTVVCAEVCDVAVGFGAQIRRVVACCGANIQRVCKNHG